MDDDQEPTFFPLTIKLDRDGIDWTHFFSRMDGHVLTIDELPESLRRLAASLAAFLLGRRIGRIGIIPDRFPLCQTTIEGERDSSLAPFPSEAREEFLPTIRLLAWWMEWCHRMATGRGKWKCLECTGTVTAQDGHCANAECLSWRILPTITGNPILSLVVQTANAS